MANGTVEFFGTESVAEPSIHASWVFQNGGAVNRSKSRAAELGRSGDEIRSAMYDEKSTTSFTYLFVQTQTPVSHYVWPKIGVVLSGWHVDGFSCVWSRDKPAAVLTLNCHRHGASGHDECRTYTPSLAEIAPPSFGVPASFGDAFALDAEAVVDLRSATYAVQANHVDELKRDGTHLRGDNYDCSETLSVELTGKATSDDYETEWDMPSDAATPSNTGATTTTLSFEHHVAHDVADAED